LLVAKGVAPPASDTLPPAAKSASRYAIGVQHVPARIITAFAVCAESVNLAVRVDAVWGFHASRGNGQPEMLNWVAHIRPLNLRQFGLLRKCPSV
jgi:ABC-type uncharacterized transport system ATPase subunit